MTTKEAQVVYERQPGGDLHSGPCEFVRVGVRYGNRVMWIESAHFPGSDGGRYQEAVQFASDLVARWNEFEVRADVCVCGPDYRRLPHEGEGKQQEANARLIAAAPDLYEACQAVMEYDSGGGPFEEWINIIAKVRAAIAKAECGR